MRDVLLWLPSWPHFAEWEFRSRSAFWAITRGSSWLDMIVMESGSGRRRFCYEVIVSFRVDRVNLWCRVGVATDFCGGAW